MGPEGPQITPFPRPDSPRPSGLPSAPPLPKNPEKKSGFLGNIWGKSGTTLLSFWTPVCPPQMRGSLEDCYFSAGPPTRAPDLASMLGGWGNGMGGLLELQGSRESVRCRGHHVWVSGEKNCLPPFRSAWSSPSGEVKLLNVHTHTLPI